MKYTVGQRVDLTDSFLYPLLLPKNGMIIDTIIDGITGKFVYVVEYDAGFGGKKTMNISPELVVPLRTS